MMVVLVIDTHNKSKTPGFKNHPIPDVRIFRCTALTCVPNYLCLSINHKSVTAVRVRCWVRQSDVVLYLDVDKLYCIPKLLPMIKLLEMHDWSSFLTMLFIFVCSSHFATYSFLNYSQHTACFSKYQLIKAVQQQVNNSFRTIYG